MAILHRFYCIILLRNCDNTFCQSFLRRKKTTKGDHLQSLEACETIEPITGNCRQIVFIQLPVIRAIFQFVSIIVIKSSILQIN